MIWFGLEPLVGRLLPRSGDDEARLPDALRVWTHWWESNAVHLIGRGSNGTF